MPKYRVVLETTASAYAEVEADDREAAIEAAFEDLPSLCAQCGGWGQDWSLGLGEFDVPQDDDGKDADYAVEEVAS